MTNLEYAWVEDLPKNCPPPKAVPPDDETFFRLVDVPVTDRDYSSNRRLFPQKFFKVSECIARSTSLFDDPETCAEMLRFPRHRGKKVARLVLPPESGLVMPTGERDNHVSWWRAVGFDPIAATVINNESTST